MACRLNEAILFKPELKWQISLLYFANWNDYTNSNYHNVQKKHYGLMWSIELMHKANFMQIAMQLYII